jgi:hypothetical protein
MLRPDARAGLGPPFPSHCTAPRLKELPASSHQAMRRAQQESRDIEGRGGRRSFCSGGGVCNAAFGSWEILLLLHSACFKHRSQERSEIVHEKSPCRVKFDFFSPRSRLET